jgi:hypothetical protein
VSQGAAARVRVRPTFFDSRLIRTNSKHSLARSWYIHPLQPRLGGRHHIPPIPPYLTLVTPRWRKCYRSWTSCPCTVHTSPQLTI